MRVGVGVEVVWKKLTTIVGQGAPFSPAFTSANWDLDLTQWGLSRFDARGLFTIALQGYYLVLSLEI